MPTRAEKVQQVAEIEAKLRDAQGAIVVDYRGLTVAEDQELRRRLREAGVEYRVVKNTLARRAAEAVGIRGVDGLFEGPTAIAFALTDPVPPAKELTRFAKDVGKITIKGGILGDRVVDAEAVRQLSELPSRQELLARVIGGAAAPLIGFAAVTRGLLRNVVYAFDALRRQREEAA